MLKSRGRTNEVYVMETEGWPQVTKVKLELFNHNKDFEYD